RLRRLHDARASAEGELPVVPRADRRPAERGRWMARVGLMLYSVREDCDRDLEGTLREVAAMGYEGVELYDLHGHAPEQVRSWLDELGLAVCGRHISLAALEGGLPALAAESLTLGHTRVIVGWVEPPVTPDDARMLAGRMRAGVTATEALGLELGF